MIWRLGEPDVDLVAGALRSDGLSPTIGLIVVAAAAFVVLQLRDPAAEEAGYEESHTLLLGSVLGMVPLAESMNLISFFIALELLSIPPTCLRIAPRSREVARVRLKYLIVGSIRRPATSVLRPRVHLRRRPAARPISPRSRR